MTDDGKLLQTSQGKNYFIPYSFHILLAYLKSEPNQNRSLAACAFNKTKQDNSIKNFLLECGICTDSDWGILNSTTSSKIKEIFQEFYLFSATSIQHLSEEEIQNACSILKSYHRIYRGDRRQNRQYGPCQPPSVDQQQRIMADLRTNYQLKISPQRLIDELKSMANRLRDYRIYTQVPTLRSQSLDTYNFVIERESKEEIADPNSINETEQNEIFAAQKYRNLKGEELKSFLDKQIIHCLDQGIEQGFQDIVILFKKRQRLAHLLQFIQPALRLLYCEGISQTETAFRLNIKQAQISKYIQPLAPKLFQQVKQRTQAELIKRILDKVSEGNLIEDPEKIGYLDNLVNQVECFFEEKIFLESEAKIGDVRTRKTSSLYLQRLCMYFDQYSS